MGAVRAMCIPCRHTAMKVLLVGSGGREHTLAWAIRRSPRVQHLYVAPGNAGIGQLAECVDIPYNDVEGLRAFAQTHQVDLTIVGPEEPLARGLTDAFLTAGLRVFGPTRAAARIESSKVFAKTFMQHHGIPTAEFTLFDQPQAARQHIQAVGAPIVVKACGLAAGKGAIVCRSVAEALDAVDRIMVQRIFGRAGDQVVIEAFLEGEEASVFAFCDGRMLQQVPIPSQDHKAVFDRDQGPNTGGMGAYAPAPVVTPELTRRIHEEILQPFLRGMAAEGMPYQGVIYAGLMITEQGPKVVEFNCRLGDPEAQVTLPLLQSDLVEIALACCEGRLDRITIDWSDAAAVCVVLASGGYPRAYQKGKVIQGLERLTGDESILVFHAGTRREKGTWFTNGGRVLGITALDQDIKRAIERAYQAVGEVYFEAMHYRRDIGYRALQRMKNDILPP